jgi:hypothetical protein
VEAEFNIPGIYSIKALRVGDEVTFEGVRELAPNPNRRWWQIWKPRFVEGAALQKFRVVDTYPREGMSG